MKIGLLSDAYYPITGGVSTSLLMLKEGLIKMGHEVYVITPTARGYKEYDKNDPHMIRIKGVPFPLKGLRHFRFIPFVGRYFRKIKKLKLDVIHVHTEFSIGILGKKIKDRTKVPMVFTVHTMYEEYINYVSKTLNKFFHNKMRNNVIRLMNSYIKRAEVTIVPSNKTKDLMISYGINGNYEIVPTGIEMSRFYKKNYTDEQVLKLKESLGLKDEFVCLYVGRISSEKSIDVLIKGFKKTNYQNMKFLIVGDGPYMSELKALVKKENLENNVIFTGMISWDLVGLYYQLGDVFLNASLSETQGLTYIEALASGLPLIVKYDKVLENVVTNEYNGLFFHENEELPELINKLSQSKEISDKLKENAYKSVKKYSKEEYAKNATKVYEEAIEINKK